MNHVIRSVTLPVVGMVTELAAVLVLDQHVAAEGESGWLCENGVLNDCQ